MVHIDTQTRVQILHIATILSLGKRQRLVKLTCWFHPRYQGPYFSYSRNNDAHVSINDFETDMNGIRSWLPEGDSFVVDRGYRDAGEKLIALGIVLEMPHSLEQGQIQFTTEEANLNPLITETGWVIESETGHDKTILEFFDQLMETVDVVIVQHYAALINRFYHLIQMVDGKLEMTRRMLERSPGPNLVQQRVERDNLRGRIVQ